MIRERISSGTVLLLAYTAANLRFFHVRRNAIILKCEWPKNPVRNATAMYSSTLWWPWAKKSVGKEYSRLEMAPSFLSTLSVDGNSCVGLNGIYNPMQLTDWLLVEVALLLIGLTQISFVKNWF